MPRGLPQVGEIIAEKYRVTGLLGRGGMGAVYVVEHVMTGKKLAVKCLLPEHTQHPELVERFLREAAAAGRIQHRNVVDVFDVGRDGELLYIVMELLEGKTLNELLRDSALPLNDVLLILLRAMEGVAAAHAHGIVHRDLKPENIIVCAGQSGRLDDPRVLDFGISKLDEDATRLTKSGVMMGTPYYMSFEQIASQRDLDQRVDVYAMGVIVYEAVSGRVPYTAESVGALAVQMMSAPPVPLSELRPDLPPGLVSVVMRSIAKERDERYPTMEALIDAMRPFVQGELGVSSSRTSVPLLTPARSLRLTGDAPTIRATPAVSDAPLRVFEHDEVPVRRPTQSAPTPWTKFALMGGGAVLLGALAFVALSGGEDTPAPEAAGTPPSIAPMPGAPSARASTPPAPATRAEPAAGDPNAQPPTGQTAPTAGVAEPDANVEAPAEEEPVEEPLPGRKGAKKKPKKRAAAPGKSLEEMVPEAPPLPDSERESAPAPAPPSPSLQEAPAGESTRPEPARPEPARPEPVREEPTREEAPSP